ncbi:hypothetical protein CERSUDRAFT_142402, partial [Gelatoporia subvermispora B]
MSSPTISQTYQSVTPADQATVPPSPLLQTADLPEQQIEQGPPNFPPSPVSGTSVVPMELTLLWKEALDEYAKQTGTELDAEPLTILLKGCNSVKDIMTILEKHTETFNEFRDGGAKVQLLRMLKPIATAVLALQPIETLGEGVGMVFQPARTIVGAIVVLLKATKNISSSYDSLVDLLSCVSKFLERLYIYTGMSLTMAMKETRVKTLANVISILALATKEVEQNRLKKYPSINHNLALRSYSEGTCAWFIDGQVMGEWKTASSLLWINGKPGSGKTMLCTAMIENIRQLCLIQSNSILAYFYCDFQDAAKQSARGLLSHLLIHFSAASHACSQLLSDLWSSHRDGSQQPSEPELCRCLKRMLELLADHDYLYIIIDALDECPDSSLHSKRRDVLTFIREMVEWRYQNVHICVTSRPEQDIREAVESLSHRSISLHAESGQSDEISSYVRSVIESDCAFRRWKASDRALAIQRLSKDANGMFRWAFCQLEMIRQCLPATIRKVLDDLPKTLDETYRRVLQTLDTPSWEYTHRLFECLIVCIRPLRVDELAEVLAIDYDSGPIPQYWKDWRPMDPTESVLSLCS